MDDNGECTFCHFFQAFLPRPLTLPVALPFFLNPFLLIFLYHTHARPAVRMTPTNRGALLQPRAVRLPLQASSHRCQGVPGGLPTNGACSRERDILRSSRLARPRRSWWPRDCVGTFAHPQVRLVLFVRRLMLLFLLMSTQCTHYLPHFVTLP